MVYNINPNCIQKLDPNMNEYCRGGAACAKCGWNVDVHNKRVRDINENGLTLCEDGLRRYIVHAD